MSDQYYVSTDKAILDIPRIHEYLSLDSYWAQGRDERTVRRSIENSLCFGLYDGTQQIGFARVVTDKTVFAWLADVFVLPEYQKKGLGQILLDAILDHTELQTIKRWMLATNDAHAFYAKFGFDVVQRPDKFMQYAP